MLWIRGDPLKKALTLHPETRSNAFPFNHASEEGGMAASEEVPEQDPACLRMSIPAACPHSEN